MNKEKVEIIRKVINAHKFSIPVANDKHWLVDGCPDLNMREFVYT